MKTLDNERGIALLTVLGLLSVLLVLASLVAGSSRMEAALSGLGKVSARAFAAAEAGLNYGIGDVNNFVSATSLTKTCAVSATCAASARTLSRPWLPPSIDARSPVRAGPVRMFTTPGGTPASSSTSASASIVNGVSAAGFNTHVQPAASAGPTASGAR